MTDQNKTLAVAVANNDTVVDEYVVLNEKTLRITKYGGNAVYQNDVKIEIFFGAVLLFVTHGDDQTEESLDIVGDGEKTLKILLTNDSSLTETIRGWYRAHYRRGS